MTSSWVFLSTLNYDARSTTHQIYKYTCVYIFVNACISGLDPRHIDLHYSFVPWMLLFACFVEHHFTTLNQQKARWIVHCVVWVLWTGEFCVPHSCGLYRNNMESVALHYICISVNLISSHYTFLSHHYSFYCNFTELPCVCVSSPFSFLIVSTVGKTSVWRTFFAVGARELMANKISKRKR